MSDIDSNDNQNVNSNDEFLPMIPDNPANQRPINIVNGLIKWLNKKHQTTQTKGSRKALLSVGRRIKQEQSALTQQFSCNTSVLKLALMFLVCNTISLYNFTTIMFV